MAIKLSEGSHFYEADGKARYEADLRVARKENLFVSPTTLESQQWKNAFLDKWKLDQLAKAAYENPRQDHDTMETYMQRIYEFSIEKAKTAAEFGGKLHDAIEAYPAPPPAELVTWYSEYAKWHEANVSMVHYSEKPLVDRELGIAGRCDRCVAYGPEQVRAISDYKTQDVKTDDKGRKKPNFYPSFIRQLAFYAAADAKAEGMFPSLPVCISLIIDSNPDGLVYEKVWSREETIEAYRDFVHGAYLWFRGGGKRKPFWPVGEWSPCNIQMPE